MQLNMSVRYSRFAATGLPMVDLTMNDWQLFIDNLVEHTVWPVIVLIGVRRFSRPIERLLDRVIHIKASGFDIALGDAAKRVALASPEADLSASLAGEAAPTNEIEGGLTVSHSAISNRPLDIINREWRTTVDKIDELVKTNTNINPSSLTTKRKLICLLRNNIINEAEFESIMSLFHARSAAVLYETSMPVGVEKAYEFGAIATANNHILSSKIPMRERAQ